MEVNFGELFATLGRYLLSIQLTGYLDIAILAFVIYHILILVRSTRETFWISALMRPM